MIRNTNPTYYTQVAYARPAWYCVVFLTFLLCGNVTSYAQTKPHLNNYLFNYYLINPAVAGIEDFVDIKSSFRTQWNGLEGAPETLVLTVHGNVEGKNKVNPERNKHPSIDEVTVDLDGYNARPHHGFGGMILADRIGPFSKMQVNGSYAYHIPLSKKYRLAAGLSMGVIYNTLDQDKITLHDPNDIAVSGERYSDTNPDLGFGLWVYSKALFAGISGAQLFKYNQTYGNYIQSEKESYRHFILTAGYKLYSGYDLIFTPSVSAKWLSPAPLVIDYNLVVSFIDRVSLGLTYRNNNEFILSSRFVASPLIEFGYAFDFGSAAIDRYNSGSHEIYLGLRLRNKYKILCPVHL
jgi:type IX secretion system PorP/SprF family membrane protein